jgi:hypothetical protein
MGGQATRTRESSYHVEMDEPTPKIIESERHLAGVASAETDLQTEIQNLRSAIMRTVVVLDRFCETVARARDAVEQMDLSGKRQARAEDKWE